MFCIILEEKNPVGVIFTDFPGPESCIERFPRPCLQLHVTYKWNVGSVVVWLCFEHRKKRWVREEFKRCELHCFCVQSFSLNVANWRKLKWRVCTGRKQTAGYFYSEGVWIWFSICGAWELLTACRRRRCSLCLPALCRALIFVPTFHSLYVCCCSF